MKVIRLVSSHVLLENPISRGGRGIEIGEVEPHCPQGEVLDVMLRIGRKTSSGNETYVTLRTLPSKIKEKKEAFSRFIP